MNVSVPMCQVEELMDTWDTCLEAPNPGPCQRMECQCWGDILSHGSKFNWDILQNYHTETWKKCNLVCGFNELKATNSSQDLTSPGYPLPYYKNLDCLWTIFTLNENEPLLLEFESFDVSWDVLLLNLGDFRTTPWLTLAWGWIWLFSCPSFKWHHNQLNWSDLPTKDDISKGLSFSPV